MSRTITCCECSVPFEVEAWALAQGTPVSHGGVGTCLHNLRDALAAARSEVEALTKEKAVALSKIMKGEEAYAGSVVFGEVITMLENAGCGKPGTPNTVWAMTKEIIARAQAAESKVERHTSSTEPVLCLTCGKLPPLR